MTAECGSTPSGEVKLGWSCTSCPDDDTRATFGVSEHEAAYQHVLDEHGGGMVSLHLAPVLTWGDDD